MSDEKNKKSMGQLTTVDDGLGAQSGVEMGEIKLLPREEKILNGN